MPSYENALEASGGLVRRVTTDRQNLMRHETEDFLRAESEAYKERQEEFWHRDYSSPEALEASVEPNRRRWLEAVGDFGPVTGEPQIEQEPFFEDDRVVARWITVPLYGNLRGRGVLALPKNASGRLPLVIAQHGIGSSPERVFGFGDDSGLYHGFGRRMAEEGYAVLAPFNITEAAPRARYQRMALMLGKTLWGLEIAKIRCLLDYACAHPQVDPDRVAMWGISLGGAYTMFTTPLEKRIKVAIPCAWFNHRVRKMAIDDPRHSCFLSTNEEHIFIPGWLREFTDSDLVSMICPRPLQIQCGKADGIAWWPWVLEEFAESKAHYERLGLADRIELDLHEGGHEIRLESGLRFLKEWL